MTDSLVETAHVVDNIAVALRHNEVFWRPLISYVLARSVRCVQKIHIEEG